MKRSISLHKLRGTILWFLVGLLGAVVVVTVIVMQRRDVVDDAKTAAPLEAVRPEADATLGKISQVSTRDGRMEWRLEADSAQMMEKKNHLRLDTVKVVFFMKDGQEVYLTARKGVINTETKDIAVAGNVVIISDQYRMTTERLKYYDKKRIVKSKSAVRLTDGSSTLVADRVVYNLDKQKSIFKGHVAGLFNSNLAF